MIKKGFSNILILVALSITFVIMVILALKGSQPFLPKNTSTQASPAPKEELKIFQSKMLKFSIEVPGDFQIKEELTFVDLIKNDEKINISKNSTNENDVYGYVEDFDKKRTGLSVEEEIVKLMNLDSVKRIEQFSAGPINQQKVYYIYAENKVYSISTTSESLYDELDQIAQSFRYIP